MLEASKASTRSARGCSIGWSEPLAQEGREIAVVGLPQRYQDLFSRVQDADAKTAKPAAKGWSLVEPFGAVGESVARTADGLNGLLVMLGQISWAVVRVALNPRRFRMTSAINQLDRVGWQAVPIILLITFLIGCIIAQQGFFHFRKFGADEYVVDMVGILILREIGVLIVAIMVAGRSGSAYTAELGSMKMREEIDALRTMGLDPVEILVLPRVIALIIALPMLDFVGSMAALYGGGLTAWLYGHMSPEIFVARLKDAISITHFKVGHDQGAVHGAGDRRRRLRGRLRRQRQRGIARQTNDGVGCEVDLPRHRS